MATTNSQLIHALAPVLQALILAAFIAAIAAWYYFATPLPFYHRHSP